MSNWSEFSGPGHTETTLPSDQYKRAVLRPPPSRFSVEFLQSTKSNGVYNHGMRISPIIVDDHISISSRGTHVEYDIWRRWEDCLYLQEVLESEYRRAAREKKTRLAQGKGVKSFNGMYKQDMASSWESLPPGPDPNSVAQDIHDHLPRLTKKGTLFRASQATVDQRQREFCTLVETLFSDGMPALIQEIRASSIVTDFFGLWRRDYDHLQSSRKSVRGSVTSSVFSSYFSESSPSFSLGSKSPEISPRSLPTSPAKRPSSKHRSSMERPRSSAESDDITEVSRYPASSRRTSVDTAMTHKPRRRALSVTSSDSSSMHSDRSSDSGSTTSTTPAIVDDVPIVFGHNPQLTNDRPNSMLEVLPEEREMLAKSPESYLAPPVMRRVKASSTERKANRTCSIVGSPVVRPESTRDDHSIRESWQTTTSIDSTADDILEGLGLSLPNSIKEHKFRASMASISTFMTTDSAEAMFPHTPTTPSPNDRRSFLSRPHFSTGLSLSDFEIYSDVDDCNSILDAFPRPTSYLSQSPDGLPETPVGNWSVPLRDGPQSNRSSYNPPPSPTSTISTTFTVSTTSTSSSMSPTGSLSIKAAHNTSIIVLRVPREIPFADIKQRLYNKFVGQEGIPLSQTFSVAFVPPTMPASPVKGGRARSSSVSSADRMELQFIDSQSDWDHILSTIDGSKVVLRILNTPKS